MGWFIDNRWDRITITTTITTGWSMISSPTTKGLDPLPPRDAAALDNSTDNPRGRSMDFFWSDQPDQLIDLPNQPDHPELKLS